MLTTDFTDYTDLGKEEEKEEISSTKGTKEHEVRRASETMNPKPIFYS
jgi:hypothetical protein